MEKERISLTSYVVVQKISLIVEQIQILARTNLLFRKGGNNELYNLYCNATTSFDALTKTYLIKEFNNNENTDTSFNFLLL